MNNILFNKFDKSFTVNFTWSWTTANFLWVSILSVLISACCRYQVIKTRNTVVWTSKTNSVCVWSVVVQRLQDAATDYCVMHHCCSSCLYQTYSQTTSVALCTLTFDIYHHTMYNCTVLHSGTRQALHWQSSRLTYCHSSVCADFTVSITHQRALHV